MTDPPSRWRAFRAVDDARDARRLGAHLDAIASIPVVKAEKQRAIELLQLAPGDRVLDVGCGNGADLPRLAAVVAPRGRVVGLDRSAELLAQAEARAGARPGHGPGEVELVVGDAEALPFADAWFDACRADRTLQHTADPTRAVAELARVLRPGGHAVVTESRWGLVAPGLDRETTRRLLARLATEDERTDWLGHRLAEMLEAAGLGHARATTRDATLDHFPAFAAFTDLAASAQAAIAAGSLTRQQAAAWCEHLRSLFDRGDAFAVIVIQHVSARKP